MSSRETAVSRLTEEQLDEVVRRLVDALSPRRIILFGSHAYGKPGPDSDVDIMIVVDQPDDLTVEFLKRAYACLRGSFVPFELHFRSLAKFERWSTVQTSLEHEVVTKGTILYAA